MCSCLDQVAGVKCRPCFGSALQLCVDPALGAEAVPEVTEILEKCRSIAEYFREISGAREQFERAKEELGLTTNKLKLDYPARWNSTVIQYYTVSQKKLCKLIFCQNFVKF